jgi:hypothetical protein
MNTESAYELYQRSFQSLLTAITDQDTNTITNIINELCVLEKLVDKYHFPMNVRLYEPILTARIRHATSGAGDSVQIKNALKPMRILLGISDQDDRIGYVIILLFLHISSLLMQMLNLAQNCESNVESLMVQHLTTIHDIDTGK